MTAPTTRRRKAAATPAVSAPAARRTGKRNRTIDFGADWTPLFDELAAVSLARSEAEAREKEIKDMIKDAVNASPGGGNDDRDETLVLRVAGAIRAKIGLRGRTNINAKALLEGFPEAYASCSGESEYQVISPA